MPIVSTNDWLTHMLNNPRSFEEKLAVYFPKSSFKEVIHLLTSHGMFRIGREPKERIEAFIKKDLWRKLHPHFRKLQKLWNGPDIPVFLFPSDSKNRHIQREFNGKSGVAFSDKLFLFVRENVEEAELLAVLTHEYHHICRLKTMRKKEEDLTLLDTLVMEGLAEHAVKEQVGEGYLAPWTKYYNRERAIQYWEKHIYSNRHAKKEERIHDELLYGMRWYPKMVGYNVGYHLVTSYTKSNRLSSVKLMHISSQEIAANSGFKR